MIGRILSTQRLKQTMFINRHKTQASLSKLIQHFKVILLLELCSLYSLIHAFTLHVMNRRLSLLKISSLPPLLLLLNKRILEYLQVFQMVILRLIWSLDGLVDWTAWFQVVVVGLFGFGQLVDVYCWWSVSLYAGFRVNKGTTIRSALKL